MTRTPEQWRNDLARQLARVAEVNNVAGSASNNTAAAYASTRATLCVAEALLLIAERLDGVLWVRNGGAE